MRLRFLSLRSDQLEHIRLILLAAIVGILGALGNLGFRSLIIFFSWVFRGLEWHLLSIDRGFPFTLLIPLILLSGGAAILLLERFFPGDVLGYGFPNFLETVNLGGARIRRRWIFVKAAGAALSLGAGASVGREGPIAQIGGAIGAAIARAAKLPAPRLRTLVACGAGTGIATTFNAPMGGLMFAQEIVLLGDTELTNLTLLIVATTSGVVTSRALMGNAAVFTVHPFVLRSYLELLTYAMMGVILGVISAFFIRFFYFVAELFRKSGFPAWLRLSVGLFIVGLIAIPFPENLSDGYPIIDRAMAGTLSPLRMGWLAGAKFVASSISLGSGVPGGVFGPIFFIGAMAGGGCRALWSMLLPGLTGPRGSYALVGLGAFLGATTNAPLTALFLLFEMTQDYQIALPAMVTTILAILVARSIERESIDTYALARQGKTLHIARERIVLSQIPVSSVMTKNVTVVPENASLADVLQVAGETPQAVLPVVDSDGRLMGVIVTRDLLSVLGSGSELSPLVNAYDLCRPNAPTVTADTTLDQTNQVMEFEAIDELPVVEAGQNRVLLGLVSRASISEVVNRARVSLSALGSPEMNIYWATGYRVARLPIPHAASGKTLRELDPRARFDVSVLALQIEPGGGFLPPDPAMRLRETHTIVVAGRADNLRRFERALSDPAFVTGSPAASSS